MNLKKIKALIQTLQYGSSVADPATWKKRQVAVNAVVGLLSAGSILVAQMGWIPQSLDSEAVSAMGEGVVLIGLAVVNTLGTWSTSKKVGPGKTKVLAEEGDET